MKEFKGTGGKWFISPYDVIVTCVISTEKNALGHETICYMNSKSDYHDECNAQLIAAAPELLQKLQETNELIEWLFDNGEFTDKETAYNSVMNQINSNEEIINKALGL